MGYDYNNYEMVQNPGNYPYTIFIHTKQGLERDGHLDENGKMIVPHLMNHWHEAMEIDYIFNGSWQFIVNGQERIVSKDEFIVINCGDIHGINFDFDLEGMDTIGFTILIGEDFLKAVIPDLHESIFDDRAVRGSEEFRGCLRRIYQLYTKENREYTELAITAQITMLLYELCASGAKKEKASIPINSQKNVERLRGILLYLEENYTEDLSMEAVAERFHFSRTYFTRFFKNYTGMTFKEYLTRFRIEKARELLLQTDLTVTEIAMRCGFSDSRRFILSFSKYYTLTPHQYRLKEKRTSAKEPEG